MILLFGSNGQIGGALRALLGGQATALSRAEADLADPASIEAAFARHSPSAVINAAAYTQVDKAESQPELAHAVNAEAPGVMARLCADRHIPLIHYSTDYVFSGVQNTPWTEDDATDPVNLYGVTKRAGEEAVIASGCQHLIFRTSWVYDETGHNFMNTILRLAREREELKIVADQHGSPSYAGHIAAATLSALENARRMQHFPTGIYHLTNAGEATWHAFAEAIVAQARTHETLKAQRILPITTAEYPTPAARPHFSTLDCSKAKRVLDIALPSWQEGLTTCMNNLYAK